MCDRERLLITTVEVYNRSLYSTTGILTGKEFRRMKRKKQRQNG